jgi:hypothetical protein
MNNPRVLTVMAASIDDDPEVSALIREVRASADAFVFLSGGASKMSDENARALLGLLEALTILADEGLRFGVGDGGTEAGIMLAAGRARARSAHTFPLIGVCPARVLPPHGTTPVDPNHSVIIAVDNPDWSSADGYFGSETAAMYRFFARLAQGRRSVAVVANGGGITLTEVDQNIRTGRPMVLVRGSGRAADVLIAMLGHAEPGEDDADLRAKAEDLNLLRRPDLFHEFALARGPEALARTLLSFLPA